MSSEYNELMFVDVECQTNMVPFDINVDVFEDFRGMVSRESVVKIVDNVLGLVSPDTKAKIDVIIADDCTVRRLNKEYRGLDENTDVLAFSSTLEGKFYGDIDKIRDFGDDSDFVLPPGEKELLGEIVISFLQAERQAVSSGHLIDREIALLLTHGVLHLLGYDHLDPNDEKVMKLVELEAMNSLDDLN